MLTYAEEKAPIDLSSEAVAKRLNDAFQAMQAEAPFKPGDPVRLKSRVGVMEGAVIGDVAVVLCDMPGQPWTWVLCEMLGSNPVATQVATSNLALQEQ